ncbi:hypothetical protein B0H12DRAFT_1150038 [Mycena haematopus]|nr:hypothetical protein B0H12DRAFT_1150038 [Mycena haematopus]
MRFGRLRGRGGERGGGYNSVAATRPAVSSLRTNWFISLVSSLSPRGSTTHTLTRNDSSTTATHGGRASSSTRTT